MYKILVNGRHQILMTSFTRLRRKNMINEIKQHGNKIVDEVKNLWGYHVFKILIVVIVVLLVV